MTDAELQIHLDSLSVHLAMNLGTIDVYNNARIRSINNEKETLGKNNESHLISTFVLRKL